MTLSDYLYKFEGNNILKLYLDNAMKSPEMYVEVKKKISGYEFIPTQLFLDAAGGVKSASLEISMDYSIMQGYCGCVQFYKNNICVHEVALYAIGLYIIDPDFYEDEMDRLEQKKLEIKHNEIMELLSNSLKSVNTYFGSVRLVPVIEEGEKDYLLSVKIGYDKDYVVKDIAQFIQLTEKGEFHSYGQRLEFYHSYESLDSVSKDFYSFLRNIVNGENIKSIEIRKSQLLKILEIYAGNSLYFKTISEEKATLRTVNRVTDVEIALDANYLKIVPPMDSSLLVSGVNHAYFMNNDFIYTYTYKSRMEAKLFDGLYKVDGALIIDVNSESFISNLLPLIKNSITIDNEFYEKYPVPDIKINSYFTYLDNKVILKPKIACKEIDRNSPYIKQLLDGYLTTVVNYGLIKENKTYVLSSIEDQYKFLTSDLSPIKAFGEVFFDEEMKTLKAKKTKRTAISVSYDVGLLDFKFENEDLTPEELQALLKAYHQKKKFIKLKDNTILEITEEATKEIDDFLEDFNISINELSKPVRKPLNYLLKLVSGQDTNLSMDDEVVKMIKKLQNYKKANYDLNENIKKDLREYQMDAFKWLKTLASFNFGGILADDMGLGKTLEVISFLSSDHLNKPSLIVCPMSLVYNWENECDKWHLDCPYSLILGTQEERENIIKSIDQNKRALYITSYDSLRRDVSLYQVEFRFVIADEAQFIKNQFAQKSEAIKSLKSDMNFALTGTPIENGLADLWSIFDYLMPGYLSDYSHFKSRYESLIAHDDVEALDTLKKRVAPFILRRTKKDVLSDLPDKTEEYYYCKMESKQRGIYDSYVLKLKEDIKAGGNNILALLTRLRQICITPELILQEQFENTKINLAADLIRSSIEGGHRILVFSQFAQGFPILSRELDKMDIKHFILDGTTKAKMRMDMVQEFNSNTDIKVFIISLKAGGTGLNLTGADMVIHMDPWWNSSAELQATDRAYRLGQTKNVSVIKLICKDTIEEKVIKLQEMKRELAESVVAPDQTKQIKLSTQDILNLLE
ncbi:MAG: DEAD/DEAH box helicase [Anaeroplasma sp.]|uniref:DEAD/DEAH box helicase n=1 Tax=Anaeroplasma sp. TaxID=1872523 RepID=UPI002A91F0B3|nr:DEAD/DEAH box helicase [Anaeroplasma sp.]MDY5983729.1 DEAD/DEAH box helicase [Anaeroplasma sp.]